MKKIKNFLASSIEDLREDRLQVGDFFRQLNEIYLDSEIHFSLIKCEDYDNSIHINDSVFYKEGIEKGEYTLSETDTQRIPAGEYIIMVSSELKGYSGCVDDAYFVVEE